MIKRVSRASGDVWQVYGRRDGRKVYVGSFDSKRLAVEAEENQRVVQRKIDTGELPRGYDVSRTFGASIDQWIAKLHVDKQRSADEYEARVELYMRERFAAMSLVAIRKEDVIAWRDRLLTKVAPGTANTVIGTLSSAFTWFVEKNYVATNPCFGVRRPKSDPKIFPWLESPEVITRLLAECPTTVQRAVALLVGTGMRFNELLFMQWDDIDFAHRLITVCRGAKGKPKSGYARRIPIFDSVMPVLRAMKLARGDSPLLFPGERKGKPLTQPSIRDPFKLAVVRAGVDKRLRVHDLRHTFASLFLVDGGDIFKLSKILGHSSVTITERTYAHLKPDAFEDDYGRVRFAMPSSATVLPFVQSGRQQGDKS